MSESEKKISGSDHESKWKEVINFKNDLNSIITAISGPDNTALQEPAQRINDMLRGKADGNLNIIREDLKAISSELEKISTPYAQNKLNLCRKVVKSIDASQSVK